MSDERARRKPSGALELDLTIAPEATGPATTATDGGASGALTLDTTDGAALDDQGPERIASRVDLPDPKAAPGTFRALPDDATLVLDDRAPPRATVTTDEAPEAPAERALRAKRLTRALLALAALLALTFAALALTPLGRGLLPEELRAPLDTATRTVKDTLPTLGEKDLYTFTDDEGVVHIVDGLDKIPEKYRARAKLQR
ncbi:hypothetical protein L6R52_09755 [Myxococcota bacterium]|nr:hypothetical protein [Myxococcota bacterium]